MIKNWTEFNEGKQLDLFQNTPYAKPELIHNNLYPIDEDDIRDYLTEIEDEKYIVRVDFGFYNTKDDEYTELIDSYKVRPCISIDISTYAKTAYAKTGSDDVTSCLTSFVKRVSPKFKEIKLRDRGGFLNINDIKLDGSITIKSKDLEIEGDLSIDLIWFEDVNLTDKLIYEYYGFPVDKYTTFTDKGKALIDIPIDTITDWVIPRNSHYKEIIDDPDYDIYQWYDSHGDWMPDHNSFFTYYLENETIEMLLRCCFKNFDELKDKYPEFLEEYSSLEDFIQNMSDWSELGEFLDDEEPAGNIYNEIRVKYADWSMQAKAESDYEEIINDFDKSVVDVLETTIVEKPEYEETKRIRKVDSNGNSVSKEITYIRTYYRLEFNLGWLVELDSDTLFELGSIESGIGEWVYNNHYDKSDLNPHFSDYVSIDSKQFNNEAISDIEYQMGIK